MSVNEVFVAANPASQALLAPYLRHVGLNAGRSVYREGDRCETVYFPTTAVLSRRTPATEDVALEVDMIGRFEVAGLLAALSRTPLRGDMVVQISGSALAIDAEALRNLALADTGLMTYLLEVLAADKRRTELRVGCNTLHSADQRLACWLLRAQDRVEHSRFMLTQETLSHALGVQRTTLNAAALMLKRMRAIRYARGGIEVVDRPLLHSRSCGCYDAVRATQTIEASVAA